MTWNLDFKAYQICEAFIIDYLFDNLLLHFYSYSMATVSLISRKGKRKNVANIFQISFSYQKTGCFVTWIITQIFVAIEIDVGSSEE